MSSNSTPKLSANASREADWDEKTRTCTRSCAETGETRAHRLTFVDPTRRLLGKTITTNRLKAQDQMVLLRATTTDLIPMVVPMTEAESTKATSPGTRSHAIGLESIGSFFDFPVARAWIDGLQAGLIVKLRNVGRGPALMRADHGGIRIAFPMSSRSKAGSASAAVVGASDEVLVVFASHAVTEANDAAFYNWLRGHNPGKLTVRYTDLERKLTYETVMDVGTRRPNPVVAIETCGLVC
jgi:hypothetical protein